MRKQPIPALTGLRFWLALWVILYHLTAGSELAFVPYPVYCLLRTGFCAVGVFFLLSGFILAYNYDLSRPFGLRNIATFGAARFARIYPVYLLGFFAVVPLNLTYLSQNREAVNTAVLHVFCLQAWVPLSIGIWNSPGWSISNEAFFYLSFPLLGAAIWRARKTVHLVLLFVALWALALAVPLATVLLHVESLDLSTLARNHHSLVSDFVRFDPLLRLPEFLAGVVVAKLYTQMRPNWAGRGYWFYGPAFAVGAVAIVNAGNIPYPVLHNGLLLPAAAALILGLSLEGGPLTKLLSTRPLVFLGGASYSMYILHLPIISWLGHLHWEHKSMEWITCLAAVIAIASAVFLKFEEPANAAIKRVLLRPHVRTKTLPAVYSLEVPTLK